MLSIASEKEIGFIVVRPLNKNGKKILQRVMTARLCISTYLAANYNLIC